MSVSLYLLAGEEEKQSEEGLRCNTSDSLRDNKCSCMSLSMVMSVCCNTMFEDYCHVQVKYHVM